MKIAGGNHGCFVNALSLLRSDERFSIPRGFCLRKRHVNALRKVLDRLLKLHALHVHDEIEHSAALVAAKAVIQLAFAVDTEGRRLFIMKRTQAPKSFSLLLQADVFADDLFNGHPAPQLFQPRIRKPCCHFVPFIILCTELFDLQVYYSPSEGDFLQIRRNFLILLRGRIPREEPRK